MKSTLIAFAHAEQDPACRFRIGQFVPYLENAGWHVSLRTRHPPFPWITPAWTHSFLRAGYREAAFFCRRWRRRWDIHAASRFDVVFLNRDLLEGKFIYEDLLFRRNPRVIFDFDDAIFLGEKERHIGQICERSAWVIAGNEYLASFARRFSPRVSVIPTVIDTCQYKPSSNFRSGEPVRIGWLGSGQSIRETLYPHLPILAELQRELGFELVIVSSPRPDRKDRSLAWRFIEWSPLVETQIADLFDVGIMPLVDEPFQRGKCGCKILQYMSASLPVIASPVGINRELIDDGSRGVLASDKAEWGAALATLIADEGLRHRMGQAGRTFVEQHYSLRRWFPDLLSIIEAVAAGQTPAPVSLPLRSREAAASRYATASRSGPPTRPPERSAD